MLYSTIVVVSSKVKCYVCVLQTQSAINYWMNREEMIWAWPSFSVVEVWIVCYNTCRVKKRGTLKNAVNGLSLTIPIAIAFTWCVALKMYLEHCAKKSSAHIIHHVVVYLVSTCSQTLSFSTRLHTQIPVIEWITC